MAHAAIANYFQLKNRRNEKKIIENSDWPFVEELFLHLKNIIIWGWDFISLGKANKQ